MKLLLSSSVLLLYISILGCSRKDSTASMANDQLARELIIENEDEQAIFDARTQNNDAIARHDAENVAADYIDNFFILTSTNGYFDGKENVQGIYQSVFDSRTDVLFVRSPYDITTNLDWNMASEQGTWTGTWKVNDEEIEVGGDYYAKWHKIDNTWKLRSEVYTQHECSGDVVCNNKPELE